MSSWFSNLMGKAVIEDNVENIQNLISKLNDSSSPEQRRKLLSSIIMVSDKLENVTV